MPLPAQGLAAALGAVARPLAAAAAAVSVWLLVRSWGAPSRPAVRLARLGFAGDDATRGESWSCHGGVDGSAPAGEAALYRVVPRGFERFFRKLWPMGPEVEAALAASGTRPEDVQLAGVVVGLAALAVLLLAGILDRGLPPTWLVAGLGALAVVGPRVWISGVVGRHRAAVAGELPKVAELLTLGTESGLELLEAARLAASLADGPAGRGLRAALVEVDAGRETSAALRAMAARIGGEEVAAFVGALVQGLSLGAPVARVLRIQADGLRVKRRQALEARIASLSLKLTVVTILFFVPALFVLAVLPNLMAFLGGRW